MQHILEYCNKLLFYGKIYKNVKATTTNWDQPNWCFVNISKIWFGIHKSLKLAGQVEYRETI